MEQVFIPLVLGTGRKGRESENVARFVFGELIKQEGIESEFVDIREHTYDVTVPPWGDGGANKDSTPWKQIMEKADGLIIVTPEYNHGYPGELKLLLDSLYTEYEQKPVALCGVSRGAFGGTRVINALRQVLIELKMVPIRSALYFGKAHELFDEKGAIKDEQFVERTHMMFDDLLWYARALKSARES